MDTFSTVIFPRINLYEHNYDFFQPQSSKQSEKKTSFSPKKRVGGGGFGQCLKKLWGGLP